MYTINLQALPGGQVALRVRLPDPPYEIPAGDIVGRSRAWLTSIGHESTLDICLLMLYNSKRSEVQRCQT